MKTGWKDLFSLQGVQALFLPAFLSLYLVFDFIKYSDPGLYSFPARMVGEATLDAVSISARVGLLTRGLLILISSFLLFQALFRYMVKREWLEESNHADLNYVALAGIFTLFFGVFGMRVNESIELVFFILLLMGGGTVLTRFTKLRFTRTTYILAASLAIAIYFPLMEAKGFIMNTPKNLAIFPTVLLLAFILLIGSSYAIQRGKTSLENSAYICLPFLFWPFLSIISDELYLILNNREIYSWSPSFIYGTGSVLILIWLVIRIYRAGKKQSFESAERKSGRVYLPLLIVSLSLYAFYEPVMEISRDMFELGNPGLGIQRFYHYGELPLLETFNSHLFAELFYGFLYTIINGFQGAGFKLYFFLNRVVYGLVAYYFFRKMFNNSLTALFITLFLAYVNVLVPRSFYLVLLSLFLLYQLLEHQRVRDYLLFFALIFLFIIWRIDIGFANMISMLSTTFILYFLAKEKILIKRFFITGIIGVLLVAAIAFFIAWIKGIPVIDNAMQALHYFSSSQTYGYTHLLPEGLAEAEWHYFIFPAAISLFVLYFLFGKFREYLHGPDRFAAISLVFLTVFYFSNFQRGIVRHGLVEGTDEVHTSFSFLLLALIAYFIFHRCSRTTRQIIFLVAATGLVSAFHYGGVNSEKSTYQHWADKTRSYQHVEPQSSRIQRGVMPEGLAETNFEELKAFMDENFPDTATFIDFSNTPMLYFYLQRPVPSYFNQNLLSIHDEYLQKTYVEGLKRYNIPVVVYSSFPRTWFDAVDGVPNEVRHFYIAEHIFNNYRPFAIMDNHAIWIKREIASETLGIKKEDNHIIAGQKVKYGSHVWLPDTVGTISDKVVAILSNPTSAQVPVLLLNESYQATAAYTRPDEGAYYHLGHSLPQSIRISGTKDDFERSFRLYLFPWYPDLYSAAQRTYSLRKLPAIWGTYDRIYKEKYPPMQLDIEPSEDHPGEWILMLPRNYPKSEGNYIRIQLNEGHGLSGEARLEYGISEDVEGAFNFTILPSYDTYIIRISTQYRWMTLDNEYISIKLPVNSNNEPARPAEVLLMKGD